MKAIRIHRFGDPEVLELDEVPVPRPGENELLVRIHAASVNPIDYKIRRGALPAITPDMLPITLGRDGSGTIEAIGPGMNAVRQGDCGHGRLTSTEARPSAQRAPAAFPPASGMPFPAPHFFRPRLDHQFLHIFMVLAPGDTAAVAG